MTMTDSDEQGKLFIGGLSWETTKENLRAYFSQFGEIVDTVVMKNNETGRSRGFGFITYKDPSCVAIVLSARPHQLNGRTVDPKECTPRAMQRGKRSADATAKVFLGGLPPDITESELRRGFSKFGKVTEVIIMYDQEKKKPRGFGFLSFESEDSIDRACGEHFVSINGKQIECKRAEPRENSRKNTQGSFGGNQWGEGRNQNWRSGSGNQQGGYQEAWGGQQQQQQQPQQQYAQQGNYGNYQNWGSQPAATNYSAYGSAPSVPYTQPNYQNYGTAAGTGGYDYSQTAGATAAPTQAYGTQPNPYDGANYAQNSSGYGAAAGAATYGSGQSASYGGGYAAKSQGYGAAAEGSTGGYGSQSENTQSTRGGQGYHPYRR